MWLLLLSWTQNWFLHYGISELRAEIDKLKSQTGGATDNDDIIGASLAEIASLKEQLQQKEKAMLEMTR